MTYELFSQLQFIFKSVFSLAQKKSLDCHIQAWSDYFYFFILSPSLHPHSHWYLDCLSLVSFTLCKYCLLLYSSWQEFNSSQCSHLESILKWGGIEGKERRIGLLSLQASAADPTLLKLIQWLVSESVIANVMSVDMQRQTMSMFHNSKRCHRRNVCLEKYSY